MKNTKEPRLMFSTFPSGRWVLTGQNGEILTSQCSPEKSFEFGRKNDTSPNAGALALKFNWAILELPIEYKTSTGDPIFTDRGNRVSFDREEVTDHEICLALIHAQQKFGLPLTLVADDPIFTARMARLADEMGLAYKH